MELITSKVYESIRSYWKRRTYKRLEGSKSTNKTRHVRLGGRRSTKDRRSLKLRPISRLRMRISSPIRILARLRDTYVDAMLRMAGGEGRPSALKKAATNGQDGLWGRRMPKARQISEGPGDFERRMMLHIYRSIVAPPEITAY